MCLYVGSEVILANLLTKKNGVTPEEISSYCQHLGDILSQHWGCRNVYINLNTKEMNYALSKYNKEFRYFQGRYFANKTMNLSHFNARYDDQVIAAFSEAAQMI